MIGELILGETRGLFARGSDWYQREFLAEVVEEAIKGAARVQS